MSKDFLVTFHLKRGQIQLIIFEQNLSVLQKRLWKDILDQNIIFLEIGGNVIFTKYIKGFDIKQINNI
ncbi:hypothetical protein [Bacillus sp. S10(2024)]|uniref:hypothetical protein n=1 Tax=Bacillus sp. S10(2024) TaxID=3162886 RepID=UPI003D22EF11